MTAGHQDTTDSRDRIDSRDRTESTTSNGRPLRNRWPGGRRPQSLAALGRQLLLFSMTIVVIVSISTLSALRMQATSQSRVVDSLDPYSLKLEQLRSALVNQETGIRGFALESNPALLEPYMRGSERADKLIKELRSAFEGHGDQELNARLDRVTERMGHWRTTIAEPLLNARTDQTVAAVGTGSRRLFDQVRAELDAMDAEVARLRENARQDLVIATRLLWSALTVGVLSVPLGILFIARRFNREVTVPLHELNQRSQRVADGEYDTVLGLEGVLEVAQLSESVDTMRDSLISELAESEGARRQLDAQTEELHRSNRDLEQFAYVASHDLQEPLRKVASFCQLLGDRYREELDERGQTYVDFAVDGAQRMQALIADLLQFSRVGRTTERFEDVSLDEILADAISTIASAVEGSGASIDYDSLPVVRGDRTLLTTMFANILSNAIKYRSEDPPHIDITCHTELDGWTLSVTDNGIGIPGEYREKVFVIFQRLHGRGEYEGTGIGLALCKKIIEFHGGSIDITEPETGPGTRVLIRFPIAPPQLHPAGTFQNDAQRRPNWG